MKHKFIEALKSNNLEQLKNVHKSDLHNHATRGADIRFIEEWCKQDLERAPHKFDNLMDMQEWYNKTIKPVCIGKEGFLKRIEGAFRHAKEDGVKLLSMSFGVGDAIFFDNNLELYVKAIHETHQKVAKDMQFIPVICFGRTPDIKPIEKCFDEILSLNYFKSIDLVGDDTHSVNNYKNIYKKAKENGYILKAHVGEFGDAESIRKAVDILELDQVQHGISAVESKEVMKWLATNKIQLNVCPTSNVMLKRVEDYKSHPIQELYHVGISVTINTDDMLIFNQSVSMEYLNIYKAGILSASELNQIRENGLIL
ncbi:amidohydrolase family protein [Vallitalea okinawensis]|uniref:adenosine deaminase n=1 Tax=Vallitalea okinawensis TaxID=2078660 RepID=UPI000CFBF55A|nr:adenosine deaminase [Vallitalea okinawensis]